MCGLKSLGLFYNKLYMAFFFILFHFIFLRLLVISFLQFVCGPNPVAAPHYSSPEAVVISMHLKPLHSWLISRWSGQPPADQPDKWDRIDTFKQGAALHAAGIPDKTLMTEH